MLLWIAIAALTAAASLAVLVPLGRTSLARGRDAEAAAIYKDQLEELARDRDRELIGPAEAEAARIEIARRLLKSDGAAASASGSFKPGRVAAIASGLVVVPLIAIGVYLAIGSPHLPDEPLSSRPSVAAQDELQQLLKRVEDHLAEAPEDGRGWEILGPIYMRLGRFDEAVKAFGNARRILGATAARDALYGEAVTRANGNIVTADARAAFQSALAQDPADARSAFYLALGLSQSGQAPEAIAAWTSLIAKAPADAAWLPQAQAQLASLTGQPAPQEAAAPQAPGPTAADVAASASQTPDQRQQMIEGMVSGLAARLDAAPDDAEGWARLFRAYIVLGRPDDAQGALARARVALSAKPEVLAQVEQAARENGIIKN